MFKWAGSLERVVPHFPCDPIIGSRDDGRGSAEHRMVVYDAGWDVHHLNGDKADNRFENLELVDHAEHARRHTLERWARRRAAEPL